MRRVVFVLASGVAFVLALGVAFLDWHGGLAQAAQPGKCPPGSTYEKVAGYPAVCANKVVGTPGNDVLYASKDPRITNKIYGQGGDDRLYGYGGRDGLSGGRGHDTLYGGRKNDALFGDSGRDKMYGGPGGDEIYATDGEDTVYAGPGNDFVYATDGNSPNRDIISCGGGHKDEFTMDNRGDVVNENCESENVGNLNTGRSFWDLFMGEP